MAGLERNSEHRPIPELGPAVEACAPGLFQQPGDAQRGSAAGRRGDRSCHRRTGREAARDGGRSAVRRGHRRLGDRASGGTSSRVGTSATVPSRTSVSARTRHRATRTARSNRWFRHWIGTWSKSLADAGVPSGKIYSHIAFTHRESSLTRRDRSDGRSYSRSVMYTPPAVAFGETHRPGFSTYPDADVLGDIYAALDAHGNPPWASAEGTNVDVQAGPPRIPDEGMQDYLARMFNHGATMTNVFGWGHRRQRQFVSAGNRERRGGRSLPESSSAAPALTRRRLPNPTAAAIRSCRARMRALPGRIESYRRAGGDLRLIQPQIKRLTERYEGRALRRDETRTRSNRGDHQLEGWR